MTIKDLRELIKDLPDTADVYVEADHGQSPEPADGVSICHARKLPYYGDDLPWCPVEESEGSACCTAVLIRA